MKLYDTQSLCSRATITKSVAFLMLIVSSTLCANPILHTPASYNLTVSPSKIPPLMQGQLTYGNSGHNLMPPVVWYHTTCEIVTKQANDPLYLLVTEINVHSMSLDGNQIALDPTRPELLLTQAGTHTLVMDINYMPDQAALIVFENGSYDTITVQNCTALTE